MQVIYRESKMEPNVSAESLDSLGNSQKSACEKLYAQLSPENQIGAPRLHSSQLIYFMPRQVKFITF